MKFDVKEPQMGDIVRVKVSFYYHYGIFVSENEVIQFGLADGPSKSADEIFVLASDVDTFLMGGELEVGEADGDEKKKLRSREEIVEIARKRIGEGGYDILHNNCEHFATDCVFGESSSFLDAVREKLRRKLGK